MNYMATVVNSGSRESAGGFSNLLAVILLIAAAVAFLYYGLPLIQGANSGPSINVPSNVNLNTK